MSARSEPRLTRDAVLAVLVTDDRDAESLVRDLQARGWRVVAAIEQNVAGALLGGAQPVDNPRELIEHVRVQDTR